MTKEIESEYYLQCRSISKYQFSIQFMEGPLLNGLYWEYAYNKGNKKTICPGGEEARALGPCPLAPSDRNILYENRLLGLPR